MKINPVYRQETKVSARSFRLPLVILVCNSVLALAGLLDMYFMVSQVKATAEIQYSGFLSLYLFVAAIEFTMLLLIVPALTAGSISGERERQTLNLMLSTQMTPAEIVLGKLISSMINMALLVISSFPVISLVFIYGGIQLRDLGLLLLLYLSVALLSSSLGLCFSAVCKRSTMATALSYGFLGFLLIGTYAINFFVWSIAQMGAARYVNQVGGIASQVNSGGFFYLLLLNPALTFYLVIGNQVGDQESFLTVMQYFGKRQLNPVLNAWIPFSICLQIFLSVIFLTIAVRVIDPMRGKKLKKQL